MAKKVIQVPIDEELLNDLDNLSQKQRKARSELIRQACICYLQQVENAELDKLYQQGYKRIPEESEAGGVQVTMVGEFMPKESW